MRNLRNDKNLLISFPSDSLPPTAATWDPASDSLICAFGPSEESAVIEIKRFAKDRSSPDDATLIASWDAPSPLPDLPVDKPLSLQYFADTATICLILAGGDLVIVREEPLPGEDLIEIVGSVDAGINAAAWSPDEELLALNTRADTLIFMTRDFESIANNTLSPEDVKVSAHVSVGWGKKETQFHGKRAKAMRDPTVPEHIDEGLLSPSDGGETTISWRGDGTYVAVNSVTDDKRRMIRVFTREGILDSVSEPVDGLEGALSWRPAGNLMATVQRLADRTDIVFFERNGLRHGQFTLRLTSEEIQDWASAIALKWNSDSTVLAISFKDRVQLWTMGNYHYYLKQEIPFSSAGQSSAPVDVSWHPEKPLHLSLSAGHAVQALTYSFVISGASTSPSYDLGLTAVVDGRNLKLTPLRVANVPPPMAFSEVDLPGNTVDVAINHSATRVAVLHGQKVSLFQFNFAVKPASHPELIHTYTIPTASARQIAFAGEDSIVVLCSEINSTVDTMHHVDIAAGAVSLPYDTPAKVSAVFPRADHECLCFEDDQGVCFEVESFDESASRLQTKRLVKLPVHCPSLEVWKDSEQTLVFGLSANGTLYAYGKTNEESNASERLQVRNCTSFLVTPAHLIFTTTQHLLKFVHIHTGNLEVPLDEPEKDERCRSIERGAKLVNVMPTSFSLVLQMPRGNLETIYPRALVLAGIRRSITEKDYKTAFFACRNHRVDMNILHDYAPQQFMTNVLRFVKQLKKVEHIDLFLSQLRDEDVAETMYKETLSAPKLGLHGDAPQAEGASPSQDIKPASGSKINRICDAFLDVLRTRTSTNLQNIITSHVCKSPPDLDSALGLIAELRANQPDLVERAVEHTCFLADVNQLYDHALGLYDLDVTLLVAQQSQKDPREYLPYVQGLGKLTQLRRQFTIDNDLKKYDKALGHLFALDEFEEVKTYMSKHELHQKAVHLYRYQAQRLTEIMRIYADFLNSRNRFKEAGIAYEYLNDYSSACDAYRAAIMWRECLSSATLIPMPEDELVSMAESLAEGLIESKDHFAAATIQLDYLGDVEAAVRTFCKGYFYAEAMRVLGLRREAELLTSVLDPGLVEGSATMTEMLADMKGQLAAQVPRLRELRQKKAEDPLAFYGGDVPGGGVDIPDNISLASTQASTSAGTFMTRYTSRSTGTLASNATRKTSKNRRREERKRARGKKGSVYEEEYLVNSIGRLIERANSISEEVRRLVEGLMRRAMRERAAVVEAAMGEVTTMCSACIPEVFQVDEQQLQQQQQQLGHNAGEGADEERDPNKPAGGEGVFWESQGETLKKREPPVVKQFARLSLLG
ncbi:hypothetical protein AAFC00_003098 [Neodothiora populina]|uniref:Elongator complex protein 1 n=1 Tax=Neodothiora populina TaxID=2781224 RepID=A0ABR3P9I9_9PEZI